jgi:hypothetical protein
MQSTKVYAVRTYGRQYIRCLLFAGCSADLETLIFSVPRAGPAKRRCHQPSMQARPTPSLRSANLAFSNLTTTRCRPSPASASPLSSDPAPLSSHRLSRPPPGRLCVLDCPTQLLSCATSSLASLAPTQASTRPSQPQSAPRILVAEIPRLHLSSSTGLLSERTSLPP